MGYRSSLFVLAAAGWLTLGLVTGCNAALGIEEARLRPSEGGAAGTNGTGSPALRHTGVDGCVRSEADHAACSNCISKACGLQKENSCLQTYECRDAMDAYSACLGASCSGSGCLEEEFFKPNSPVDRCYGTCEAECATSPVYSACQLYCACMGSNCPEKLGAQPIDGSVSKPAFASMADCLTQCAALPPEHVACRRSHCELAELFPKEAHCDHATGAGFCGSTATLSVSCRDKSLNSFGCRQNSECCSGNCDTNGTRTCIPL